MRLNEGNFETAYTKQACIKSNDTVDALWSLSRVVAKVGLILTVLIGIAGFITGIAAFDGKLFLLVVLIAAVVAATTYLGFYITAAVINALGHITYNTMITAKGVLLNVTSDGGGNSKKNYGNNTYTPAPDTDARESECEACDNEQEIDFRGNNMF